MGRNARHSSRRAPLQHRRLPRPRGLAAAAALGALLGGCNALWGIDALSYDGATGGAGTGATGAHGGESLGGGGSATVDCEPGTTRPCYTGPARTEDVGPCHGGTETCLSGGDQYGPCEGEVTPQPDDCQSEVDENCDGYACGETIWAKRFGDVLGESGSELAVDGDGNVVVVGIYAGGIDFGGPPVAAGSTSYGSLFVAKLSPAGDHLWSRGFVGSALVNALGVSIDGQGDVVLASSFEGAVDFGGGTLASAGGTDVYVVKLSAAGEHLWSQRFGDADPEHATAVGVDAAGAIFVAGYFRGTIDFGGGPLISAGTDDVFVTKLGADGSHQWSLPAGDAEAQTARDLAVDASGNVLVTGYFRGSMDFGGGALASAGERDVFVVKLTGGGDHVYSHRFGDAATERGHSIALDPSGHALLAGYYLNNIDFGGGVLTSAGAVDAFVAKLDPAGDHVWSQRFGQAANQGAFDVASDTDGNVLLAGYYQGGIDLGGGVLSSPNDVDHAIFVAKLTPGGAHVSSRGFVTTSDQPATWWSWPGWRKLGVDPFGNVLLTGYFHEQVDFGLGPLTSAGLDDVFLVKLAP